MKKTVPVFILMFPVLTTLHAQDGKGVGNVEINVFENYKAEVRTAAKLNSLPNFDDTTVQKLPVNYSITPRIVDTRVRVEPIPAASIARSRVERLPENMIQLGMGNYTTPELALVLANARNTKMLWSVSARHFSTQTGALRDRVVHNDNRTMTNRVQANLKYLQNRWRWSAGIDIDLQNHSYYGIPKISGVNEHLIDTDPLRQRYYSYGINASVERANARGTQVFRNLQSGYYFLHDLYSAQEHNVHTHADWTIGAGEMELNLGTGVDYLGYSSDSAFTGAMAFRIKPTIYHEVNGIYFTLGLNLNYVRSTIYDPSVVSEEPGANDRMYFYPEIKAELPLVREVLNIYGGWVGNMDLNGLKGLSRKNPYIKPGIEIRETGITKFYAGFSGRISKRIGFNLEADYFRYANRPLFYRDSAALATGADPYYKVNYVDMDAFSPRVELSYHHPKNIEISVEGTYIVYSSVKDDHPAFHLPKYQASLHAEYTWKEKVVLKTNYIFVGPRTSGLLQPVAETPEMPIYMDWRFYAEYRYNDYLSAYLKLNNLLNSDYDLWYGYPSQGTRFILGLALRF